MDIDLFYNYVYIIVCDTLPPLRLIKKPNEIKKTYTSSVQEIVRLTR